MICSSDSSDIIITGRNEVVAKVMFLHVCVILFTGGVSGQGEPPTPPGRENHHPTLIRPPGTRHPPEADTPHPGRETPPRPAPRGPDPTPRHQKSTHPPHPPPREAHSSIRSTSGRYASYWNAFLFNIFLHLLFYKY